MKNLQDILLLFLFFITKYSSVQMISKLLLLNKLQPERFKIPENYKHNIKSKLIIISLVFFIFVHFYLIRIHTNNLINFFVLF